MYIRVVYANVPSMPLLLMSELRDSLNKCILRAVWNELLEDPWHTNGNPPVLDIHRVCDGVGSSAFIVSLWVGGCAESILREQINVLNNVKVRIDQFIEISGAYCERVPVEVVNLWEKVSIGWNVSQSNGSSNCADIESMMTKFFFLEKILHLSDPLKFIAALNLCDPRLHWGLCKLYSEDLDNAVELLSRQIEQLSWDAFSSID